MSHQVEVWEEVRRLDMPALAALDEGLPRVVAEIVRDLHRDPWLGVEMRERANLAILANCRKVPFDLPKRRGKPRFRLVYRNDPDDGSVAIVSVLAVGERTSLAAYRAAAIRLGMRGRGRVGRART